MTAWEKASFWSPATMWAAPDATAVEPGGRHEAFGATLGLAAVVSLTLPAVSRAADPCPAAVVEARAALKSAQVSLQESTQVAQGQPPSSRVGKILGDPQHTSTS